MRRKYANETGSFQERLFKHLVVKQEERDGKLHEGPGVGPLVQAAGLLKDQHNATQLWPALTVLPEEDGSKDCSCQQGHQGEGDAQGFLSLCKRGSEYTT